MLRRVLGPLVLILLATTGVGPGAAAPTSAPAPQRKHQSSGCSGLSHQQVRGDRPTFSRKKLAAFPNHRHLCKAWWLPRPRKHLVPQGVAVSGRSAWISGFRYREGYGERACRFLQLDLRTGQALDRRALVGQVGRRPLTYCRHGGGTAQTGQWLWAVQKRKLWLFDPASQGTTVRAARVWRLASPVLGSSVVFHGSRIGLVPFTDSGKPHIYWFSIRKLVRPDVLDIGARRTAGVDLAAADRTAVPTRVQGAAIGPDGGLYLARSNLSCGELVLPSGRRVGFVPGAEGIQFGPGGERLWAVSESGAEPYAGPRKPLTPVLSSFEWPDLAHGRRSVCNF